MKREKKNIFGLRGNNGSMDNKSMNTYISEMEDFLRVKENFDILCQKLRIGGRAARLYSIDGLIKDELMQKLMQYWMSATPEQMSEITSAEQFSEQFLAYTETDICAERRK